MASGTQDVQLKGITWDHPRGRAPLEATARAYEAAHPGVSIRWEARSLQAFADFPLAELARAYDLLVIDHPHVGAVAREGCLVPLDDVAPAEALTTLARQTAGRSHDTYQYAGRQWALAIDASTQMAAYRPDRLDRVPARWEEVAALARSGAVLWPIKPVDALMSFLTLAANRGTPCANSPDRLIDADDGHAVLEAMRSVSPSVPPECLELNPIQVLDRLSGESRESGDGAYAYCPLLYGYANYARAGFRPHMVKFANIPALGSAGPMGSTIGGTGLAISAHSREVRVAVDYALWVAGAECQSGLYFSAGGQPGNAVAWSSDAVNAASSGFFRDTRETLDRSWLRPRYDGYLDFQQAGGDLVHAHLAGGSGASETLARLEEAYKRSRSPIG